jgi:putative DNA methylase
MTYRKKLIEVALPLEAINQASVREKNIRHGHPSTLHLWWARRPLAACRAVLFASIVDDPSSNPEKFPTEEAQEAERQRLFRIIEDLVKWENSNNEQVLGAARGEIMKATNGNPPPVLDPFCGGGSIPLEAQRLGLKAHASDLNPVAVLITKALIEIPARFSNRPPVNPQAVKKFDHSGGWLGANGLAEDVRFYGQWMREEAERRIGHLYPKAKVANGTEATVIAWLWARTVKCPNPACGARMPMVRSFVLSSKRGRAFADPIVDHLNKTVRFEIKTNGTPQKETTNRTAARCLFCSTVVKKPELRELATQFGVAEIPLAIVCEGPTGRIYVPFNQEQVPNLERPAAPEIEKPITNDRRWFSPPLYGLPNFSDLFTSRQLTTLITFSDLVVEARERVLRDSVVAGMKDDGIALANGGLGAVAYAEAVGTYLAFLIDQLANHQSTICGWNSANAQMRNVFARQAIPMVWDFAESNPFCESSGSYHNLFDRLIKGFTMIPAAPPGETHQLDATQISMPSESVAVSTDPPYYDNIGYADLSDFFYVWLRRSLNATYRQLFSTLLVPKAPELVAAPNRFGGNKRRARDFFEKGLGEAFSKMRSAQHQDYPLTVFYAFKQTEENDDGDSIGKATQSTSTGWETMLEGLIQAGFSINGTWPIRTEKVGRVIGIDTNALASSIVLACRPRASGAPLATRREFLSVLKSELPSALKNLQRGNIAPVDFAQAAIGPGMAVFSRYSKVVESDGSTMRVRTALQLINQALDEVLAEQESEYDAETRWAVAWFEQFGMSDGPYGAAETLSTAKNTSVASTDASSITISRAGKVRLLRRDELPDGFDPAFENRFTIWEIAQHLISALETGGESAAADLFVRVGGLAEIARDLAYRLYTISERKSWVEEALAYNSLVVAWPEIKRLAGLPAPQTSKTLFDTGP